MTNMGTTFGRWKVYVLKHILVVLLACSMLVSVPAAGLVLLIGYEVFIAPPAIEYVNLPMRVLSPEVYPGDSVLLRVERCASDPLAPNPLIYRFTHELIPVDAHQHTIGLPSAFSSMPSGCQTGDQALYSTMNIVPIGTPPGQWYVQGTSTASGKFKTDTAEWTSDLFTVLPPAAAAP